jgi:hypothetical protein
MYDLKEELRYITCKTHEWLQFPYSDKENAIMLGTAATETHLGKTFRQTGYSMESKGGAFSPWGIELKTHDDIWNIVLPRHPHICEHIKEILGCCVSCQDALIGNLYYACAIARLQYWRFPEPLPAADDLESQGKYYKHYFNSSKGKGSVAKYVADYKRFVL